MNRRLALILGVLIAGGASIVLIPRAQLPATKATRVFDRRCRGGCAEPPLPSGAVYVYEGRNVGGTSGALIASWGSTGSVKDAATQSSDAAKPVLRSGGLNGRNTLAFSGIAAFDTMTVPNATNLNFVHQTGAFDMFAVYRRPIIGQGAILSNTNFNDTTWPGFWFDIQPGTGGVYGVVTKLGGATVTTFNSAGTLPIGVWRILEYGGDGTTAYVSSDLRNGSVETQAFANALDTTDPAHFTANIGTHADNNTALAGDLAAVYVWSRKLSAADKAIFLTYCRAVWGL